MLVSIPAARTAPFIFCATCQAPRFLTRSYPAAWHWSSGSSAWPRFYFPMVPRYLLASSSSRISRTKCQPFSIIQPYWTISQRRLASNPQIYQPETAFFADRLVRLSAMYGNDRWSEVLSANIDYQPCAVLTQISISISNHKHLGLQKNDLEAQLVFVGKYMLDCLGVVDPLNSQA